VVAALKFPRLALAIMAALGLVSDVARAGPPYSTDDPEPVAYLHWEF